MSKALLEAAKRIGDIFDRRTYFEWIDDETGLTVKFRTREERHQFEHAIEKMEEAQKARQAIDRVTSSSAPQNSGNG